MIRRTIFELFAFIGIMLVLLSLEFTPTSDGGLNVFLGPFGYHFAQW